MKNLVLLSSLLALTSIAGAQPDETTTPPVARTVRTVTVSGVGTTGDFLHLGAAIEAEQRLGATNKFVHAQARLGLASANDKSGTLDDPGTDIAGGFFTQLRAGVAMRNCNAGEWLCGYLGIGAGYQLEHTMTTTHGLVMAPRTGVELGRKLRWQLGLEPQLIHRFNGPTKKSMAVGATFGVGYIF